MSRGLLALALAAATALATPALAAPRATLPDIEDEVMCPVCGTPLNQAQAPQAERQRALIRQLIAEGRTKEQIKARLVEEYGPAVLATPQSEGFDLAAWLVPIGLGAAAILVLAVAAVRWRRRPSLTGKEPAPLSAGEARRLDEDLARLDP